MKFAPGGVDVVGLFLELDARITLESSIGLPSSDAPVLFVVELLEFLVLLQSFFQT
jgi:hypothetical protein